MASKHIVTNAMNIKTEPEMNWRNYQEKVAQAFRDLGATVETESTATGARGFHKIDVLIDLTVYGIKLKWVCECKLWNRPIQKHSILTFHSIVNDIGADKGFFFSESGFQAGAVKVTDNTNIVLCSIDELKDLVREEMTKSVLVSSLNKINRFRKEIKPAWISDTHLPRFHEKINFDQCVHLDGTLLFLSLDVQKSLNSEYPVIRHSYTKNKSISCPNFERFNQELDQDLEKIGSEVSKITNTIKSLRQETQLLKINFINAVTHLLDFADEHIYYSPSDDDLRQIAILMKKVGKNAEKLKKSSCGLLANRLSKIMILLIEKIYPHFTFEVKSSDEWTTLLQDIKSHLNDLYSTAPY